ncbi:MAG: hypothetical protein RLZZ58_2225 [Pseudomonadota bacterium]
MKIMLRALCAPLALSTALAASLAAATPPPPVDPVTEAKSDIWAWNIVEGLTTEVGPRPAGTEAEARARKWAVDWLTSHGFKNVREESFLIPTWVRGEEKAWAISPFKQPLAITALGNSGSTGDAGLEGDVAYFADYAALEAAAPEAVKGKIAFVDHVMQPTQDGSSYGMAGPIRRAGPNLAAKKGAIGIIIRSLGTDWHRNPHTGNTTFDAGVTPIPAGALSNPDADNLVRMWKRAWVMAAKPSDGMSHVPTPLRVKLLLTPRDMGMQPSGNVIAELPGSDPSLPPILIACHLDSWDLGTGAIDDAAGCGIITAAALQAVRGGNARTIRLLWAGAEEVGVFGGRAYAEKHAATPHAIALESDFGAGPVWRMDLALGAADKGLGDRLAAALRPFGISRGPAKAGGGADIGDIAKAQKLAIIDLQQDGRHYFDLHHTPDDTLDKIDPTELRQNVAVWTAVLRVLARETGTIAPSD